MFICPPHWVSNPRALNRLQRSATVSSRYHCATEAGDEEWGFLEDQVKRGIAGGSNGQHVSNVGLPRDKGRIMCFDGMLLFMSNQKRKFGTFTYS